MTNDRDASRDLLLLVVSAATDAAKLRPVIEALRLHGDVEFRTLLLVRSAATEPQGIAQAMAKCGCAIDERIELDVPPLTPTTWLRGAAQRIEQALATAAPRLVVACGSTPLLRELAIAAASANLPLACVGALQRVDASRDLWAAQMNLRHTVALCALLFVETAAEAEHLIEIGCDSQPLRVCDEAGARPYRRMSNAPQHATPHARFADGVAEHLSDWLGRRSPVAAPSQVALPA